MFECYNLVDPMEQLYMIFLKKFYKFHNVGVLSQDPCQLKEFQLNHINP
jgi:hypothetical protein